MRVDLIVIDPQQDFAKPGGSLFVPGADQDMQRLAIWIQKIKKKLSNIRVTLDSHNYFDVGHPSFWIDGDGNHPVTTDKNGIPTPVIISHADVMKEKWRPKLISMRDWVRYYTKSLEDNKRYPCIVWPYHCLIGTSGYNVVEDLMNVFNEWTAQSRLLNFVAKGSNFKTEHYSAVQADVPDPEDPTTSLNTDFVRMVEESDMIIIAGEASSHCVASTVKDIANNFSDKDTIKKMIFLEDCSSAVPGFESYEKDFLNEMTGRGMQISNTQKLLV